MSNPMPQPAPSSPVPATSSNQGFRLGGIIITLTIIFAVIPSFFIFFWPDYQQKQVLKTGLPAQATILEIKPTGNVYNSQPQVELKLRVQPPNEEPFEASLRMVINPVYLPQFQPQKQIQVHYDPQDKTRVAVDEE